MIVYIYGLYEHTADFINVRYVGKTKNLKVRLYNHLTDETPSPKVSWINKCKLNLIDIRITILEELIDPTEEEWSVKEREWIKLLRESGNELLNLADGGGGEWKAKEAIPCSLCGVIFTPKTRTQTCCSKECKQQRRRVRVCCGCCSFFKGTKSEIYCSRECSRRHTEQRKLVEQAHRYVRPEAKL